MEFGEKIKKLRTQRDMTQEQLASKLFISRTAISKWESGRGYPSIDLLKDIAKIFDVSVDELLSSEEIIVIARDEKSSALKGISGLIFGLLDVISILLILLPIYPYTVDGFVYSVPLTSFNDIGGGIKIAYVVVLSAMSIIGAFEILLHFIQFKKMCLPISLGSLLVEALAVLFFAVTKQPYLTSVVFVFLLFKALLTIRFYAKNQNVKKSVIKNK